MLWSCFDGFLFVKEIAYHAVISMALLKVPTMVEKPSRSLRRSAPCSRSAPEPASRIACRAAGVSIWQFLAPPIAFAILIGLFKIALFNPFSSAMLLKYEILEAKYIRGKSSWRARQSGPGSDSDWGGHTSFMPILRRAICVSIRSLCF